MQSSIIQKLFTLLALIREAKKSLTFSEIVERALSDKLDGFAVGPYFGRCQHVLPLNSSRIHLKSSDWQ